MTRQSTSLLILASFSLLAACDGGEGGEGGAGGAPVPQGPVDWRALSKSYNDALATNPKDTEASFGAFLSDLVLLPEQPFLDDALTRCGQTPFDLDGLILGSTGILAWEYASRGGVADLTVEAVDGSHRTPLSFEAVGVRTTATELPKSCMGLPEPTVLLEIALANAPTDEQDRIDLQLTIEVPLDEWANDITIPFNASCFGSPMAKVTARVRQEGPTGPYVVWSDTLLGGKLHIRSAGSNPGEKVSIELENIRFGAHGSEAIRINGTITDTLSDKFKVPRTALPFADLEGSQVGFDLIAVCGTGLNEALAFDVADDLMAYLNKAASHLDTIVTHGTDDYTFEIPRNAVLNALPLQIGMLTVRTLRESFRALNAAYEIVRNYHFYQGNLEETVMGAGSDRHFDNNKVVQNLNSAFLEPVAPPVVLTSQKAALVEAIKGLRSALKTKGGAGTFFNPNALSPAAKAELDGLGQLAIESLDGPVPLTATPEYTLDPSSLFTKPPTRQSLLSDAGVAQLWSIGPFDSIQFSEDAWRSLVDPVYQGPGSVPDIPCDSDLECSNVGSTWQCRDYRWEGICEDDPTEVCVWDVDCTSGPCRTRFCKPRAPEFMNPAAFDSVFKNRRWPAFMSERHAQALREAWSAALQAIELLEP